MTLKPANILITSVGAKVLLVQAFQDTSSGQVLTADAGSQCAAHHFSNGAFQIRRSDDPRALNELLELCSDHQIKLIVPTRDGELPFFAAHRDTFRAQGIYVLVPSQEHLEVCQNKQKFAEFLVRNNLPAMPCIDHDKVTHGDFPAFIRPKTGAGGVGTMRVESADQLAGLEPLDDVLVHPFIDAPEYSIDLLMDLDGEHALQAVCRERLHVVGGEAKISRTIDKPELCNLAMKLGEKLKLVGHNVVQLFDDAQRGPVFIEVNPRFGGASNLSIKAGLDSPTRLLSLLAGDDAARKARPIRYGLTMLRYSQDVLVEEDKT